MSTNITLFCYVVGDDLNMIFPVNLTPPIKTVGDLKDAIKAKTSLTFKDIEARALQLWEVSISIDSINEIAEMTFLPDKCLSPLKKLSEIFPAPLDEHVHVVIKCPAAVIQPAFKRRRLDSELPCTDLRDEKNSASTKLEHTPSKPRVEVLSTIQGIIERYRPTMKQLVADAGQKPLFPSWAPTSDSSADFKEHIKALAIPTVGTLPSLLLHALNFEPAANQDYIDRIFTLQRHKVLINTSGSGKTRIGLHGLCQNWGFYAVVEKGEDGIGSGDFWALVNGLDRALDYNRAKLMGIDKAAVVHMEQKARHRILQFLLARFRLLDLLVDEAQKCEGGLRPKNHRLLWVLLQASPTELLPEDAFEELSEAFRSTSIEDLEQQIREIYFKLEHILEFIPHPFTPQLQRRPFYCFLDDIQRTTGLRMGEFRSEDLTVESPLLRPIWATLTGILDSRKMLVIVSGTGIHWNSLKDILNSSVFKVLSYDIHRNIGAFDDPDAQKQYIERYLPGERSAARDAFLERAWGWCRGRYRSTAALIQRILLNDSCSPHRVLDHFVEESTNFRPTDGQKWYADEPQIHESNMVIDRWNFERLNSQQITTLCDVLYDQIICGRYSLKSFVDEEEINTFIEYGFARTKSNDHVIDEPLAIMAAWNWLDKEGHISLLNYLQRDIGNHAPRKSVFEAYLAFYMRRVFEKTPRLNDIFTFRSDFALRQGMDLAWQNENFELVAVSMQATGQTISVVSSSSGPSSNVGFTAQTDDEVLNWISENKERYAFCFPTEFAGPDIFFYIRSKRTQKLLLVAIQAKQYKEVGKSSLVQGVRTVTPSWFWKSKDLKYRSPDDGASSSSDIASRFFNAVDDIGPNITIANARYPVLRIFASWPGDAEIERTLGCKEEQMDKKTKKKKKKATQAKVDEDDVETHDPDLHPLAMLHSENFTNNSRMFSKSWYMGIEQKEVVFAQHQFRELQRSKRPAI